MVSRISEPSTVSWIQEITHATLQNSTPLYRNSPRGKQKKTWKESWRLFCLLVKDGKGFFRDMYQRSVETTLESTQKNAVAIAIFQGLGEVMDDSSMMSFYFMSIVLRKVKWMKRNNHNLARGFVCFFFWVAWYPTTGAWKPRLGNSYKQTSAFLKTHTDPRIG